MGDIGVFIRCYYEVIKNDVKMPLLTVVTLETMPVRRLLLHDYSVLYRYFEYFTGHIFHKRFRLNSIPHFEPIKLPNYLCIIALLNYYTRRSPGNLVKGLVYYD